MVDLPSVPDIADRLRTAHAGLRSDLEVTRHLFRGQPQYVVRDPLTFQTHQFSQQDYQILIALNSSTAIGDVFERLVDEKKLRREQEEMFYQFILALHQLNFLLLPIADGKLLHRRFMQRQRAARWRQATGLLFLRVPLINPDAFLECTVRYVRPLFTRAALVVWIAMMGVAGMLLIQRWDSFKSPMHSILANDTLLFLWMALVGLKVFHEFGHAYACKVFGGKVPEMGAYLIAFTPCAYVDASAAWGFVGLRQRVLVSLAGMYFESIVAFVALLVWCWTDEPLLSSCAHQVVILSTAVTIGFNINPLMRYDGYYVLSDLLGIPNLRQRSAEEVQAMLKRAWLGIKAPSARNSSAVRWLLCAYGSMSAAYKVTLVLAICTMIALKFHLVGVGLAAFFLLSVVLGTLRRLVAYLWWAEETRPVRARAIVLSVVLVLLLPAVAALVPVPGTVVVPGVTATDDDRVVYAQSSGFLSPPTITAGSRVKQQQVLCRLVNVVTQCRADEAAAETDVARVWYSCSSATDVHASAAARLRLAHAEEKQRKFWRERELLAITAPVAGTVTQIVDQRDTGRFIQQGDAVATVADGAWIVRCLATAEQIASARPMVGESVRVRIVAEGVCETAGTVEGVAVKGTRHVFSPSLSHLGGGDIAVDPATLKSGNSLFEVQVRVHDADTINLLPGSRAAVAFSTQPQTCGAYLYRCCHQFLNRLRVR
jgi:putative peptide zinc metalloprotease protein